jgi:hypothetical protein
MKFKNMTNMQKVASAINGYHGGEAWSAQNDYYFDDCATVGQKEEYIKDLAENGIIDDLGNQVYLALTGAEAETIRMYLDCEEGNWYERFSENLDENFSAINACY